VNEGEEEMGYSDIYSVCINYYGYMFIQITYLFHIQMLRASCIIHETIHGKKVDKVKSEHLDSVEFVYFDFETGLPVKQEFFKKDNLGNPLSTAERIEEYSYLGAIPFEFLDTKHVVIQIGPAPIQRDIAD
jgi:hypothetical protein